MQDLTHLNGNNIMNREIEFRGLRTDGKGWVYGGVVYGKSGKVYIFQGNDDDFIEDDCCEVIPESVGQFTGLYDKNGVKIFEGDKVSDKYYISFKEGSFGLYHVEVKILIEGIDKYLCKLIEVIGNIHEKK